MSRGFQTAEVNWISCDGIVAPGAQNVKSERCRSDTCFVGGGIFFRARGILTGSTQQRRWKHMQVIDRIALILAIIGGLNWGSIGLFRFDLVAWICGGQASVVARVIYTLVGLAAIWCISLLFRGRDEIDGDTEDA